MTFPRPDASYWNNKLAAYLHDPIDKVFRIQGHEERAAKQLEIFGLEKPNESFWKKADAIASGFERGQVPSFSSNPNQNGAVDFGKHPVITHPTGENTRLEIALPEPANGALAQEVGEQLLSFLKKEIGMRPGMGGYSDKGIFKDKPDDFACARFLYVHQGLRFKLAENDVAGLGGLWHRLPADSRFPDHTIWQHNALTSALYSCMDLAKDDHQVGILSFSITPVQPFIAKARKLRDYWTGSVILSWLAFEGLRWVMEHLGPDHLLYPSLVDQPLVNEYLRAVWKMQDISTFCTKQEIASLPNKFLCLIPFNNAEPIAKSISACIQGSWRNLCQRILNKVTGLLKDDGEHLAAMFHRQTENFWDLQWSAAKLIEKGDMAEAKRLLPQGAMDEPEKTLSVFSDLVRKKWHYEMDSRGLLYSNAHQLVQTALAARKVRKTVTRIEEPGRKCGLCAEFEVLHSVSHSEDGAAYQYKEHIEEFWRRLAEAWDAEADLDRSDSEKLCAVCLLKRIAYRILKEDKAHILHTCFEGAESFQSTTEMAMHDEFKRRGVTDKKEKRATAQRAYQKERIEEVDHRDRYYAILVMDGDNMGRLINGETIGSTWASAMHPEMKKRLEIATFDADYRNAWEPFIQQNRKRLVTPAIHAAISESLGDFSVYGAAGIVEKYEGRLIFAGGDDVCAVLPVSNAVKAAREISEYYTSDFKVIDGEKISNADGKWTPVPGKLSINLGKNKNEISISAGILICHHKEGLSQMIARAHALLDTQAKEKAGRNACAVELRKRSGGSRYFVRQWSDTAAWSAFQNIGQWIRNKSKQQVSTSLVYRLQLFRDGVDAILNKNNGRELMAQFVAKQLERSGIKPPAGKEMELAKRVTEIVVALDDSGKPVFQPEGLIVAAFAAGTESEVN
ncbi:type III-B CRISPR-associated protein Cas10/Cmr2 [Desulfococcus sp.]|uniref:type III-B CRISPR-associated protein Cas10/Cmr2 n=1 Tax=Desulfococcus sp. TaxID=2025834 RepID=UPI003592F17D